MSKFHELETPSTHNVDDDDDVGVTNDDKEDDEDEDYKLDDKVDDDENDVDDDYEIIEEILKKVQEADIIAHNEAKDKDLVLVVGNTGSGKSTFLNYLIGKKMIEAKFPGSMKKVFQCEDPVFEIGFGFESKTHFPQVYYDPESDLTYCDCPGFNDNRGVEFDVSNMYAIARLCHSARSIKGVVILINYFSLETDRAKGLRETLDILRKVFYDKLDECLGSVQIVVTREKGEVDLSDLRDFLSEGASSLDLPNSLATNAEFYDPLDRYLEKPLSRMPRAGMIAKLKSFNGIDKEHVSVALSNDSKLILHRMLNDLMEYACENARKKDFRAALHFFHLLETMKLFRVAIVRQVFQSFTLFCIQEIKVLSANENNLPLLNDLKSKFPFLQEVINLEISSIIKRIEEKRFVSQSLLEAEEDLTYLKKRYQECVNSRVSEAEEFVKQHKNFQQVLKLQEQEIVRLREENYRVQVQQIASVNSSPVIIHQQMSYDLSNSFAAMSVSGCSSRSSYSSHSSSPAGMQYVRGYTKSNGTVVQPYYRKSSR
eukprot:gene13525-14874_t